MANVIYSRFLELESLGQYLWNSSTVIRALLATNTYVADKNHANVQAIFTAGLTELSATGYSRQTLTNKLIYNNTVDKVIEYKCDNLNFGVVDSGFTVQSILLFIRVGTADDANNDIPVAYIDTATNLPYSTSGASILLTFPANGIFIKKQSA